MNHAPTISLIAIAILVPSLVLAQERNGEERAPEQRGGFSAMFRANTEERKALYTENREERRALFLENQEERREHLQERIDGAKERLASTSAEVRVQLAAKLKERITLHSDRIFDAFDAALSRLMSLEEKIDARLDELEARGVDVTDSRIALDAAVAARVNADANLVDLKADISAEVEGETSREDILAIARAAREEVAAVREAYADVLLTLRADVRAAESE